METRDILGAVRDSNINAKMNLQQSGGTGLCSSSCVFIIIVMSWALREFTWSFYLQYAGVHVFWRRRDGSFDLIISKLTENCLPYLSDVQ